MQGNTPLITIADLRECLHGYCAVLAMPGHRITHFYECDASMPIEKAAAFFAKNPELDYVTDEVYLRYV